MNGFPLSQLLPYQTNVQPGYFIAAGVFVFVFLLLRIYNNRTKNNGKKNENKKVHPAGVQSSKSEDTFHEPQLKTPDKKELKEVIAEYGFNNEQADYFSRLCNTSLIGSPRHLVENQRALDELIANTINRIHTSASTEREIEHNKTLLYMIRENIENHNRNSKLITSTRSLQNGQPFTLITGKEEHYPSIIVINTPSGILCKVPRDIFGNELRLPIWSKARILFYTRAGQAYQFAGRILRYESGKNETMMMIAHTNSVKAFPNRRHDRKSIRTTCMYSHVTVANVVSGKHTEHKFYPSPKSFPGTIIDISSGGCSIEAATSVGIGEYISIRYILEGKTEDTLIGKVIRASPSKDPSITVIHIQFAKMPRAALNRIFSYIYNYGERRL